MSADNQYNEFRKDGWPLCPQCGEDELFSQIMLAWNGEGERPTIEHCIKGRLSCYKCHWYSWKAETEERLRILRELQAVKCFCGRKKNSMKTFCPRHFSLLPPRMQSALYSRLGHGYEEAYTAARQWLKERSHPAVVRVD